VSRYEANDEAWDRLEQRCIDAERDRDELRIILEDARRTNYESAAASLVEEVKQLRTKLAALENMAEDYARVALELMALKKRIAESPEARLLSTGEADSVHKPSELCNGECIRVRLVVVEEASGAE